MKKVKIIAPILAVVIISGFIAFRHVLAEQSGSSPDSGATSYIKATYDSIVALGHGSVAAGSWGDWGSYWNRIRSAAEWVPNGTASTADVLTDKSFFSNSRSSQNGAYNATNLTPANVKSGTTFGVSETGTLGSTGPCSTQVWHDDHGAPVTSTTNCSQTWTTNPTPVTGDDNRSPGGNFDPVTGMTWSMLLLKTDTVVGFSPTTNTAFSWDASHANNQGITAPVAGNRTAIQLCADQGNDWRLPTQKELMQAYIDGSYWNLTQPSNVFWSATENSSTNAWVVYLNIGFTTSNSKTSANQLRCVR